MYNKNLRFIRKVVSEGMNKGWMGPEHFRKVERAIQLIEHGIAVKNTKEVNKAVVLLAKLFNDLLM